MPNNQLGKSMEANCICQGWIFFFWVVDSFHMFIAVLFLNVALHLNNLNAKVISLKY